ncbi:MAG: DUF1499 domain-containing protein [Candidatus Devosia phytovorans]|uniref:DUF1499 domain-containing protein n=1 Tax=Candidatus Devosia phytovorans TaxID=3121372 RepID=A0AAJ5VQP9_9HYPH|nr:DUF1499 domain-containing protein [Devosia sp.]WEK02998.1 MAG: DUF1499 domain-containing protein [Devosia sp.]
MRILIRTSRTAIWARRLGSIAVPLVIIAVVLHRLRLITSDLFAAAALVGGVVGLLALVTAILALGRLWQTGDQGWSKAFAGLFFATLSLLPYAWYGSLMLRYPAVTDMATTDRGLMPLVFEPGTAAMPTPKMLSRTEMAAEFPNAETRTYPLGLLPTFDLVNALVAGNGWDVRMLRQSEDLGQINAQIMTLPGWREEVVIRVTGTQTQSTVDMRSASLHALHDFGDNGLRIEAFLEALDDSVTALLRDNPEANLPPEAVETEVPGAVDAMQ